MDWATTENRVGGRVRVLVIASSMLCATVYLLHLLIAVSPLLYFEGFVTGYYSLLDYRLVYSHNSNSVAMPHTDYTRHISLTYAMVSLAMLILSIVSIVLVARKRLLEPAGLVYGVASSLIPTYSLLYGFLYRVMALDLGRFTHLNSNGGELVFRTNAGTIVYEGISINPTLIYTYILRNTAILTILTATAVAVSATSIALAMLKISKTTVQIKPALPYRLRGSTTYIALSTLTLLSLASIFTYYPTSVAVNPQPPPATLEASPYTYTCVALPKTDRGALAYTDFETYPVSGWMSFGGLWELSDGGGFRGNALRGTDNNGGVGGVSSQYYWNTRIDGYSSLWISIRTRAETTDGYKGIGLMNLARNRLYEISVRSTTTIYKWDGAWRLLGSTSVPGYSATRWYTLVLYYVDRGTSVDFTLWIYDDTGTLVATLSASDTGGTRFRPAYAGITIDATATLWFRFDDFIVSTRDPRSVEFSGFYTGMRIEVLDNLGNFINSTTAPAASFRLGVTRDIVVGTGVDGRIFVRYPDAYPCLDYRMPMTDAILGGDAYSLTTRSITISLGANKTSASITTYISSSSALHTVSRFLKVNISQILYARLVLDRLSAPTLNLDLWLEGMTRSTNITIRGGTPVSSSTNVVQLNLGMGNFVVLSGYFTATNQLATLYLRLELCTASGGMGVCVYYPIRLDMGSSGSASGSIYNPSDSLDHQFYSRYSESDLSKETEVYQQSPVFESKEDIEAPRYLCSEGESFCSREPIGNEENH